MCCCHAQIMHYRSQGCKRIIINEYNNHYSRYVKYTKTSCYISCGLTAPNIFVGYRYTLNRMGKFYFTSCTLNLFFIQVQLLVLCESYKLQCQQCMPKSITLCDNFEHILINKMLHNIRTTYISDPFITNPSGILQTSFEFTINSRKLAIQLLNKWIDSYNWQHSLEGYCSKYFCQMPLLFCFTASDIHIQSSRQAVYVVQAYN